MTTAVILAVRGTGEAEIASMLAARPGLVLARRCADLAEAVAAATAGVAGVVVLSDQPRLDRAVVRTLVKRGVRVVGVPSSPEAAATLVALGCTTVVPFPAGAAAVVDAVVEAAVEVAEDDGRMASREAATVGVCGAPEGALVAVWGPTGAPGRTTLAVNLAIELSRLADGVMLVDADTYGGAVAQALGLLDESPGLAGVARAALRGGVVDEAIARHARRTPWGLEVLTGITRAARWPELSAAALEGVWPVLRGRAPVTVVDCGFGIERSVAGPVGPGRDDATLSALTAASLLVVVGSGEPLGVQRLVQALGDLTEVAGAAGTPRIVVVNRVRASVAGARPGEAIADVLARYAGVDETWMIPDDPRASDAATLAGEPTCVRAPHSPFRRALEPLARRVCAEVSAAASVAPDADRLAAPTRRIGLRARRTTSVGAGGTLAS